MREFDDLVQDGYLCYARCLNLYPNASPAEFMALLKTSFANHIRTLAMKQTKWRTTTVDNVTSEEILETYRPRGQDMQYLSLSIKQAPTIVQRLAQALLSAERLPRENQNTFYCRLLGLNPKKNDIATLVADYFMA